MTTILPIRQLLPISADARDVDTSALFKLVNDTMNYINAQHGRLYGLAPESVTTEMRRVNQTTLELQTPTGSTVRPPAEGLDAGKIWSLTRPSIPHRNIFGFGAFPELPWDERRPIDTAQNKIDGYMIGPRCYNWRMAPFMETELSPSRTARRGAWWAGAGSGSWSPYQDWRNDSAFANESWSEGIAGDGRVAQRLNNMIPVVNPDTGVPVYDFSTDKWLQGYNGNPPICDEMVHEFGGHGSGANSHATWLISKGEAIAEIGLRVGWGAVEMLNHQRNYVLSSPCNFTDPRNGWPFTLDGGTVEGWCNANGVSFGNFLHYPATGQDSQSVPESQKVNAMAFWAYQTKAGEEIEYPYNYGADITYMGPKDQLAFRQRMGTGVGLYSFVVPVNAPVPEPPPPPVEPPKPCPLELSTYTISLRAGQRFSLKALSCGADVTEPTLWHSLNTRVATVSEDVTTATDGVVVAKKPRWLTSETQIEASYGGTTLRAVVKVRR